MTVQKTIRAKIIALTKSKAQKIEREYIHFQSALKGEDVPLYSATKQQAQRLLKRIKGEVREQPLVIRRDLIRIQRQNTKIVRWWAILLNVVLLWAGPFILTIHPVISDLLIFQTPPSLMFTEERLRRIGEFSPPLIGETCNYGGRLRVRARSQRLWSILLTTTFSLSKSSY